MSWLSEQVNPGDSTATGEDPRKYTPQYWAFIKQYNPKAYDSLKEYDPVYISEQQSAKEAADAAALAQQGEVAKKANVITDEQLRSQALQKLTNAFGGHPDTLVPNTLDDSPIGGYFNTQRGKATDFITNLLKRGVTTESGLQSGMKTLASQEPKARTKLNDLGNVLLEQERGKVRGIYNEGAKAAGQVTGGSASFDPAPFLSRAQQDVGSFTTKLPDALASGAGELFDTSGLTASSGAASGSQNLDFDPYAVSGGKLPAPQGSDTSGTKRRSTAVF